MPTVKPTGGVVASLTEEPTEPDVPPVEEELMEDLEPQQSPRRAGERADGADRDAGAGDDHAYRAA